MKAYGKAQATTDAQAAAVIQRYSLRHFEITGFYPTVNDMATMFEKSFEYIAAAMEMKVDEEDGI